MKHRATAPGQVTILCSCQRRIRVPAKAFGQPRSCPACGTGFRVEASPGKNPRLVFLRSPTKSTGPKSPSTVTSHRCPCGTPLFVNAGHAGKGVVCPSCRKSLRFEKARDPQTLRTVLRPVDPKELDKKSKKRLSFPPQPLLCTCGTRLLVTAKHWGKRAQCPACGTLMKLEKEKDPQTLRTSLHPRVVGKAPPPDLESWSLDDFA